jgi:hypothetical protein
VNEQAKKNDGTWKLIVYSFLGCFGLAMLVMLLTQVHACG